jgi:hypothetical protein
MWPLDISSHRFAGHVQPVRMSRADGCRPGFDGLFAAAGIVVSGPRITDRCLPGTSAEQQNGRVRRRPAKAAAGNRVAARSARSFQLARKSVIRCRVPQQTSELE